MQLDVSIAVDESEEDEEEYKAKVLLMTDILEDERHFR